MSDVRKVQAPTISQISRGFSPAEAKAILSIAIEDLINFLNVGKTMSGQQVVSTVNILEMDYGYLTLADLKLFIQQFKKGVYGKQYDRLDGQMIIQALDQYLSDRAEIIAQMNESDHYRVKKESTSNGMHPDVIAAIKHAIGDKPIARIPEQKAGKSDMYDTHQRWYRQFNNLERKYGANRGIRMIRIGNVTMDINSFLERKLKNSAK